MLTGPAATIGNARKLRKEMSLPETLLWRELRQRPQGHKFRRQHPAGPYVLDFACIGSKLAIEIDGEAHDRGSASTHDEARDEWLANQGYRTLRIPASEVLKNLEGVVQLIISHCTPNPPRHGEGDQPQAGGGAAPGSPPPRHPSVTLRAPLPRTGEEQNPNPPRYGEVAARSADGGAGTILAKDPTQC